MVKKSFSESDSFLFIIGLKYSKPMNHSAFSKENINKNLLLLQAVDANLVKSVCYEYIYDKCPVIAAVGPIENLTDYNRVRSQMYWLRV